MKQKYYKNVNNNSKYILGKHMFTFRQMDE